MSDVTKEFAEALKNKNYKNRSIAVRPDGTFRHVAFLGGAAPAVKHLKPFSFAENDEYIEFSSDISDSDFMDYDSSDGLQAFGRMFMDFIKGKTDTSFSDKDEPQTKDSNMDYKAKFEEEKEKNDKLMSEISDLKKGKADDEKKFSEADAKIKTLETELENGKKAAKEHEYNEFAEKLVKDGNILPAHKASTVAMFRTLDGQEAIDFAEADGKVSKKTPLDVYKSQLQATKSPVSSGSQFKEGISSEQAAIDKQVEDKINEYMKVDKSLTYSEAGDKAMEEHPELFSSLNFTEKLIK